MKNNNDTSREELEAMLKRAILDGLSNHTGEFANPWIFKGSYSHELLADILNDIMASERLFKNLQNLIDQHTKTMCERAVKAGRIEELEKLITLNKTLYGVEAEMTRRANNRLAELSNLIQETEE